jgi:hypothetical protein
MKNAVPVSNLHVWADGAPVSRVMYASRSRIDGPVYTEMERIRASALPHNLPAGLATALLYQSGWFIHWKEGPREAVLSSMRRIASDPRHDSLRLIHHSEGSRLLSGPWSMAIVQCADPVADMAKRVDLLARELDQGRQYSPPGIWRRISTPMRHPGAAQQADPDAFQRILVCAASGTASFALVGRLATRYREEVVHRRFAGSQNLDVGTDYVDFAEGGRVLRVIAMARNGLALPLTRAFLPDYSYVVLLLGADRERNIALLQRVAHGCAGFGSSAPPLLGVAREAAANREISSLAEERGLRYMAAQGDDEGGGRCWDAIRLHLDLSRQSGSSVWPVEESLG